MKYDPYGIAMSSKSQAAADKFQDAATSIRLYRGDPIAALDAVLAEDESNALAWGVRASLIAQATDAAYVEECQRSIRAGEAVDHANDREKAFLAGARAWIEGRMYEANAIWGRLAQDNPRDMFALQLAHIGDFFLGQQSELRDRPTQALRAYGKGDAYRHAVLGMSAFGLEECGDYARAEEYGREAVELEPRDGWAVHAVAHVMEMQGRADEGISWIAKDSAHWAPDSVFGYHNWWHMALFNLDRGKHETALTLYDAKIRPQPSDVIMEMIDASALLWRLHLKGVDVGARWSELAESWARTVEDGIYPFNDMHAVIAFIGAGRLNQAEKTLATLKKRAGESDDAALMIRMVGLPTAQAFVDFANGKYDAAADAIQKVRPIAQRFGGSHAQRDILTLTLFEALVRAGRKGQAQAIAAERVAAKPESPWAQALAKRAAGDAKAAA